MFGWFSNPKKEVQQVKEDTRKAFEAVRKDVGNVSKWIQHLNNKHEEQKNLVFGHHEKISGIDERLSILENEIASLKELISGLQQDITTGIFQQQSTGVYPQHVVKAVEKDVQTGVYTGEIMQILINKGRNPVLQLSSMERAIVYILLHSDLRLSYEDIAVMLGKDRSTIRSQMNTIKQKCPGLVEERVEKNGKKRVSIPDDLKRVLLKNIKMRDIKRTYDKSKKDEEHEGDNE